MDCNRCKGVNPEGARFCMSCGEVLVRLCLSCNTEAPPEARFCMSCGSSLTPVVAKVVSELRERLPDLPSPAPGDPAQERFRLFDSIGTFLRNASASQPMVIILDNIHFADQPSLLLMQFLVQEARDARLLIVGTYRDLETGRRHPIDEVLAALAQERRYRHLSLKGLSKEDSGKMVEALTGIAPSTALLDAIYNATEGVPLYIDEMVNLLTEEGKLDAGQGRGDLAPTGHALRPGSGQALWLSHAP